VLALALAAVAAGLLGVVPGRGGAGERAAAAARTEALPRTSTLLLQVEGADGSAVASVLYGLDRDGRSGTGLLLPSSVIATVPGLGQRQLGSVLALEDGADLSRATVSDLLGLRVDAGWVLDRDGLAALVDRAGGVTVDVDVDVLEPRDGRPAVVVAAGPAQRLDGARAAALLAYRPPGEDELAAQPRVQRVLDGVLAALPGPDGLGTLLAGQPERSTLTRVLGLARGAAGGGTRYQTLPVAAVDTPGAPAFRLDGPGVDAVVARRFEGAELPGRGGSGNRVLVLNAVGTPGMGEAVRRLVVPAGYVYAGSRNLTPFGRARTVVVVPSAEPQVLRRARALAEALGLPSAEVEVSPRTSSIADLMVVVGRDFRPVRG